MIGCGKYRDVFLYEVTEQDLLLRQKMNQHYRVGTILMFSDRCAVELGREFACSDDLFSAKEYLDNRHVQNYQSNLEYERKLETFTSRIALQDDRLSELTRQIAQRDELLRDLAESLNSQKQDNELLHIQLTKARDQLAADQLKHNELFGDLQFISSETHAIEAALERVMEEKFQLEQELAERITDLIELNLQNDDLRKQLDKTQQSPEYLPAQRHKQKEKQNSLDSVKPVVAEGQSITKDNSPMKNADSGKQIHILHEFPTSTAKTPVTQATRLMFSLFRICTIAFASILVLGVASVIATAQVNGISIGAALDLIIESLNLTAGVFLGSVGAPLTP